MELYFVRHGQSENNLLYDRTGSSSGRVADPELTGVGERQAEQVAAFLAGAGDDDTADTASTSRRDLHNATGFDITHCYTSLMVRAVATGHKIAEALGVPLLTWIDLHESGGMYLYDEATDVTTSQPGKSRGYLREHYPRLVLPASVTEAGWWRRSFETKEERAPRARNVLADLLGRHGDTDHRVLVVSHGGFFNHFMRAIFDLPERDDYWFAMHNASITRVDFIDEQRILAYMNRVDFMPPDLIT